jgi:hypothetical protein
MFMPTFTLAFLEEIRYNIVAVHWYISTWIISFKFRDYYKEENMSKPDEENKHSDKDIVVERVQTGVRMEKRMVKVLKGLAEYLDISLGDLLEGIVLHAFAGKAPFSSQTLEQLTRLKQVYGMDYGVEASHHLREIAVRQKEQDSDTL